MCSPPSLIDPLHHEKCIASSPNGGICPESIDFTTRISAHLELALSMPETRATTLRSAARLMICDNHKNRLQEAHRIAHGWEEQAAQKCRHTSSLQHRRCRSGVELCADQ
ncbi:hypothetical protein ASPSYDRAFT_52360 [Aspergillus sydowii CBS 593.65]|uniref:Uncharacterized protein n=1 Tax=Aspergillus sydowii CBS 593.65 TaxID=1036612 RepID=A0A1L9SYA3_9EURO|nr:uncharacterized protein ASPSYDRAFT_52360 [Aspergillus sydowii CBS 593.65]OJJ52136.1 hypothetical protein ASPSYDRAFT_52360 [Aspergillus sydowii CBS 593.65]